MTVSRCSWYPMDAEGVIREKRLRKLGMHASDTALLAFQDVHVPETAVLGQVGKGFYHIMWELQGERLIGAAGCVAGAQNVFDRTLQYAKERKAFGREIGRFQVIRHKFAEMATKIETARQLVYTTAWRFQNGEYPVREISMAKLYAARIAVEVADECIQIHGGAGYMVEYGIERVVARHAPEPDRRGHRRDHARRHRQVVRPMTEGVMDLTSAQRTKGPSRRMVVPPFTADHERLRFEMRSLRHRAAAAPCRRMGGGTMVSQ